jgi:hypothetical protein
MSTPVGSASRPPRIALGWRVHSSSAVVVAVSGNAHAPVVAHRETVALVEDGSLREPYHAAVAVPLDEAPALIASVAETASAAVAALIDRFASSLGTVAAVGVVGGDRRLPADLSRILSKHALLHAAERDLYERAIVDGAGRAGLPVTTIPATGSLFDDASRLLGVPLASSLAALGKSVGSPWQKDHKEATAAALLALHGVDEIGQPSDSGTPPVMSR